MLVSAVQQNESAVCNLYPLPLGPPSHPPHPTPVVLTKHQADLPVLYSSFPLAICFTHGNVYMSMLLSQFVPPSPSPYAPAVSTSLFSMYCPATRFITTIFLDAIYMY